MIFNLTPHAIHVYNESAFVNLEQVNPTTWVADSTLEEGLIATFLSTCAIVRIETSTVKGEDIVLEGNRIPTVRTIYGELTGVSDIDFKVKDLLIVSLPTQSMAHMSGHELAPQMVTPYKVVRNRANTSEVLGCCGFSFQ